MALVSLPEETQGNKTNGESIFYWSNKPGNYLSLGPLTDYNDITTWHLTARTDGTIISESFANQLEAFFVFESMKQECQNGNR
jgi:hypothetical protein